MLTEGTWYDQYIGNPVYYIIFPEKEYRNLNKINRKSIEKAINLKKESQKVKDWLAEKNKNPTDEEFFWNMIISLSESKGTVLK